MSYDIVKTLRRVLLSSFLSQTYPELARSGERIWSVFTLTLQGEEESAQFFGVLVALHPGAPHRKAGSSTEVSVEMPSGLSPGVPLALA